jgi:hypothetical protein
MSTTVLVTSITSFLGFLINSTILFLVLSRGRKKYHYLFAGIPFILAIWDIGIFLTMIRNSFTHELPVYGFVIGLPCVFLPALIYHFTCNYLNRPRKISTIFIWAYCAIGFIISFVMGGFEGVYNYSWGYLFRPSATALLGTSAWLVLFYIFVWLSCWFLFRTYKNETSPVRRRHILYIFISFVVISLANIKIAALYNVDSPALLPAGMLVIDIFGALIGISIIKHRLLDITVIIKKTTIYSLLLALIIFIFSLSEHMLATYVGEFFGGHSVFIHIISIAVVIAIIMPIRQKIEHAIGRFFERKKVEF